MKNKKAKWKEIEYPDHISTDIGQANFWLERLVGELRNGFRETDFKKKHPICVMNDDRYIGFIHGGIRPYFGYLNRCCVYSKIFGIGQGNDGKPVIEERDGRKILVSKVVVRRDYDHEVDFKSPMRRLMIEEPTLYDLGVNFSKELAYIKYITDGDFENGRRITHVYRFSRIVGYLPFETEPMFEAEFDKIDDEVAKGKDSWSRRDVIANAGISDRVSALVKKGWNVIGSCSAIIRNDRSDKKVSSFYITFLVKKGSDDEAALVSNAKSVGLETKHVPIYAGTTLQKMNREFEDKENIEVDVRGFHMHDEATLMSAVGSFVEKMSDRVGKESPKT